MILMAVGYHHAAELFRVLFDIREIGYNDVNTGHFAVGKRQTTVNYKQVVGALDNGEILTDLVKSAQRDYLNGSTALRLLVRPLYRLSAVRSEFVLRKVRAALRTVVSLTFEWNSPQLTLLRIVAF